MALQGPPLLLLLLLLLCAGLCAAIPQIGRLPFACSAVHEREFPLPC
jgi:hypothetical protein